MLPSPGSVVIGVVYQAANPGITTSDVIGWVGVMVAVAGVVLAAAEGIAAAWRGGNLAPPGVDIHQASVAATRTSDQRLRYGDGPF